MYFAQKSLHAETTMLKCLDPEKLFKYKSLLKVCHFNFVGKNTLKSISWSSWTYFDEDGVGAQMSWPRTNQP